MRGVWLMTKRVKDEDRVDIGISDYGRRKRIGKHVRKCSPPYQNVKECRDYASEFKRRKMSYFKHVNNQDKAAIQDKKVTESQKIIRHLALLEIKVIELDIRHFNAFSDFSKEHKDKYKCLCCELKEKCPVLDFLNS